MAIRFCPATVLAGRGQTDFPAYLVEDDLVARVFREILFESEPRLPERLLKGRRTPSPSTALTERALQDACDASFVNR
jgi:hypothetical protein